MNGSNNISKLVLTIIGVSIAFLGVTLFLGIVVVSFLGYGRVYLYDGYSFTAALCNTSIFFMISGAILTIVGLILFWKASGTSKQVMTALGSVALVFSIVCSSFLFTKKLEQDKKDKYTPSSSYSYSYSNSGSSYKSGSSSKSGSSYSSSTEKYPCMGKHDTCPNYTYSPYDFYCSSCDPDGDNREG